MRIRLDLNKFRSDSLAILSHRCCCRQVKLIRALIFLDSCNACKKAGILVAWFMILFAVVANRLNRAFRHGIRALFRFGR